MKIVEQLLLEGAYDKITTDASRILINMIKRNRKRGKIDLTLKSTKRVEFEDMDIDLPIFVTIKWYITYVEGTPGGYDALGYADDEEIELRIDIDPTKMPQILSDLVPILKEAIRHELEHVAQLNGLRPSSEDFDDYYMKMGDLKDPDFDLSDYFLLRHEVPAFVRGLYKAAKTRKQPLDVVIDDFLDGYASRMKGSREKVRAVWIKYAKRNLPAAKWSR